MDGMTTTPIDVGDNETRAPGTDLIQRVTLDELLGWRSKAIELAHETRAEHQRYLDKLKEAAEAGARATGGGHPFYKLDEHITDKYNADKFDTKVVHDIDRAMWGHLLKITGIQGLMDKQALAEFDRQIQSEPPEVNADNVRATFQQFKADAHTIFRRGLVNAFVALDRTYRSHDGFKIGHRVVCSYAITEYGGIYNSEAVLRDVDRIMHILDGGKVIEGWYSPLVARLSNDVRGSSISGIRPGSVTTEYWHVKWFKNRNMHLYPLRKDLVRRANRLIAEHFGEAVGEGPDAAGARQYTRAKPHHSTVEDFYPTPATVVKMMVEAAQLKHGDEVLEPSAGEGAIVAGIMEAGITPDCVEIDPDRADILRDILPPGAVVNMDFLKMHPEEEYSHMLMNPPFGSGAGVQHVFHALRFLKPGGRLVAVLGAGLTYREDGPTKELRNFIAQWNGSITSLPSGSFRTAGTDVDTVMVTLTKPGGIVAALPAPTTAGGLFDTEEDARLLR